MGGRTAPLVSFVPPPTISQTDPDKFTRSFLKSALTAFAHSEYQSRKPWIFNTALQLLSTARTALAEQNQNWKQLKIKAKRARRETELDGFMSNSHRTNAKHSTAWNVVRKQKKGFQGNRSHLLVDGKQLSWTETHDAYRDHVEQVQWEAPNITEALKQTRENRSSLRPQHSNDLQTAFGKLKIDKLQMLSLQLFCYVPDRDGEKEHLGIYNHLSLNPSVPASWLASRPELHPFSRVRGLIPIQPTTAICLCSIRSLKHALQCYKLG